MSSDPQVAATPAAADEPAAIPQTTDSSPNEDTPAATADPLASLSSPADDPVTADPPAQGEDSPADYNADIPVGDSATDPAAEEESPDEDPMGQAGTDPFGAPGSTDAGSTSTGIEALPNNGWASAATPEAWPEIPNLAAYPHALPERAVDLVEPNWLPWTSGKGLAVHEGQLFVVSREANSLVVIDRATGDIVRIVAVGERPEQVVVSPDGTAFVTVRHGRSVARITAGSNQVTQLASVGAEPYGIALSPDAETVYVTVAAENRVVALRATDLITVSNIEVPRRPRGIAVNQLGQVYVTLQYGSVLRFETAVDGALFDPAPLQLRNQNPADISVHAKTKAPKQVATRAFAAAINPGNHVVYIAHVNAKPGSVEQSNTEILNQEALTSTECETNCKQTCKNSGGYGGVTCSNSCSTSCITKTLTFPHIIRPIEVAVTSFDPTGPSAKPVEASPPVMDALTGEPMTALCDKPMDAAHHPLKSMLFVACKGTDNVLVLNTDTLDPMRSTIAEIKVGRAPTAITFSPDGATAYVRNAQSFTVSQIDLAPLFAMASVAPSQAPAPGFEFSQPNPEQKTLTQPINLVHETEVVFAIDHLDEQRKLGRRVFTFARSEGLSANGFFACETCHFEGTEDGLVWFVKDGPRQTPLLAGKLVGTEPFNWMGTAETIQQNILNTVGRMGGSGLTDEQLDAIGAFVMSDALVPPPNPHLHPEGLTESQKAGKELFFHPSLGCAECHSGNGFTDGKNWDVGTFTDLEHTIFEKFSENPLQLNTPAIRGLYYSAPYLHDGSAEDLFELLNATSATMGVTMQLTGKQRQDLVNYLLTL